MSAYYHPEVLKQMLGACRGEVRVVLNGLGGRRLGDQVGELEKVQAELAARTKRARIRLGFAQGVFHTKLYLFERGPEVVAWIGSANATGAGLGGQNEEVLMRVSPAPPSVVAYVESAWQRGEELECCRQRVNSLPAFFRTGTLYYPPYAVLQKTLNPFRPFLARLPDTEKEKFSPFHSDFADDEAGIGAFNLDKVYERAHGDEDATQELETQRGSLSGLRDRDVLRILGAGTSRNRSRALARKRFGGKARVAGTVARLDGGEQGLRRELV